MGGYQFPAVDPTAVLKAAKLKILEKKLKKDGKEVPPKADPKMAVKAMDPDGSYQVNFNVPMMAPSGEID